MDDDGRYSNSTLHLYYNTTSKQLTRLQCRPNGTLLADVINLKEHSGHEIIINNTFVDLSDNISLEYIEHKYVWPLKNHKSGLLQWVSLSRNEVTEQRIITMAHHFFMDDARALLLIVADYWQINVSHKDAEIRKLTGLLVVNFAGNIISENLFPPTYNDAAINFTCLFAAFTANGEVTLLDKSLNGQLILHTYFLSNSPQLSVPLPDIEDGTTLKNWAFNTGQRQLAVVTFNGDVASQHTLQIVQQNADYSLSVTAMLDDNTWQDVLAMAFTSTGKQIMALYPTPDGEAFQLKIFETANPAQPPQIINTPVVKDTQVQLYLLLDNIVCIAQSGKLYLFGLITQSVLQVLTYDDSHLRPLHMVDRPIDGQLSNRSAIRNRTDAPLLHIAGGNIFYFKEGLPCQFSFEHGEQTFDFAIKRRPPGNKQQNAPITVPIISPVSVGRVAQELNSAVPVHHTPVVEQTAKERPTEELTPVYEPASGKTSNNDEIGDTLIAEPKPEQLAIVQPSDHIEMSGHYETNVKAAAETEVEQQAPVLRPISFPEPEQPQPGWTGDPEFGNVLRYGFYAILIFAIVIAIVYFFT